LGLTYEGIAERGKSLADPLTLGGSRLIVHIQTEPEAIDSFLSVVSDLAKEKQAAGFVPKPIEPEVSGAAKAYKDIYVRRKPGA
jgi:threonine aldolase